MLLQLLPSAFKGGLALPPAPCCCPQTARAGWNAAAEHAPGLYKQHLPVGSCCEQRSILSSSKLVLHLAKSTACGSTGMRHEENCGAGFSLIIISTEDMIKEIPHIFFKVQLRTNRFSPSQLPSPPEAHLKPLVVLIADFQATLVKAKNFLICANIPDDWHNPNEHTLGQLKYSSVLTLIPQLRPAIVFSFVWITEHLNI